MPHSGRKLALIYYSVGATQQSFSLAGSLGFMRTHERSPSAKPKRCAVHRGTGLYLKKFPPD